VWGTSASSPTVGDGAAFAGAHTTPTLRTYPAALDANRVVESCCWTGCSRAPVFYSLKLAEHSLDELLHRAHNRVGSTAEAQRLLGRARSELEFLRPGVLLESSNDGSPGCRRPAATSEKRWALQYFHSAPWSPGPTPGHNGALVIEEGEV